MPTLPAVARVDGNALGVPLRRYLDSVAAGELVFTRSRTAVQARRDT